LCAYGLLADTKPCVYASIIRRYRREKVMNMTADHLAELLAGIARAQNAIIDAVERANGGWRNTHLIPVLNVAANMRTAEPRLLDLPSRILLRYQGRPAVDMAAIKADLERLTSSGASPSTAPSANALGANPASAVSATRSTVGGELDFSKRA
jgi:hypothetical protein